MAEFGFIPSRQYKPKLYKIIKNNRGNIEDAINYYHTMIIISELILSTYTVTQQSRYYNTIFQELKMLCCRGYLDMIIYIIVNHKLSDIIHINDEQLFCNAIYNDKLHVAQWLFDEAIRNKREINIRAHNDYCFRHACKYKRMAIIEWLESLNFNYSHKINGNEIIPVIIDLYRDGGQIIDFLDEAMNLCIIDMNIKELLTING